MNLSMTPPPDELVRGSFFAGSEFITFGVQLGLHSPELFWLISRLLCENNGRGKQFRRVRAAQAQIVDVGNNFAGFVRHRAECFSLSPSGPPVT